MFTRVLGFWPTSIEWQANLLRALDLSLLRCSWWFSTSAPQSQLGPMTKSLKLPDGGWHRAGWGIDTLILSFWPFKNVNRNTTLPKEAFLKQGNPPFPTPKQAHLEHPKFATSESKIFPTSSYQPYYPSIDSARTMAVAQKRHQK